MIAFLYVIAVGYATLIRRSTAFLAVLLIPAFALSQLPSELKSHVVPSIGGYYIYPHDVLLLAFLVLLAVSPRNRSDLAGRGGPLLLFSGYVVLNIVLLGISSVSTGLETPFVRDTLFGILWLALAFCRLDAEELTRTGALGKAFMVHNLLALGSAVAIALAPQLNDRESELASFIGLSADIGEQGSFILVSALTADVCLISAWYFLFVERRGLLSPFVVLPMILVVASAHRITYIALVLLLLVYAMLRFRVPVRKRRPIWTAGLMVLYTGVAVQGVMYVGWDTITTLVVPYIDRAMSLFSGAQQLTVGERLEQYSHFFNGYLHDFDLGRYLVGEAYVPAADRDAFYQWVQPHNFLLYTFVNNGIVGVLFFAVFMTLIVVRYRASSFLFPLVLLMVTQLTDAAFSTYPVTAYVGLLLALMQAFPHGVPAQGAWSKWR